MGLSNDRLIRWIDHSKIRVEFQAGFRKKYPTGDNIYNPVSINNIKIAERKKAYAYFVDFKDALVMISR